jgi:hypothetical protein
MNQSIDKNDVYGWPLRFLQWFCPPNLYEEIEGDLIQRFHRDLKKSAASPEAKAIRKAKLNLAWTVLLFFRPGILLKNITSSNFGMKVNLFTSNLEFRQVNNVFGWIVFFISLIVYSLTLEETASFWDCSEFIATSYKLQVPHPPGAPLFLLLGRIFSFFAFGDVTKVAYAINMMSALASAFTVLFLFWSIVLFGQKLISIAKNSFEEKKWLLISAGIVGSLSYAFSDSFWFSAAEAEVYAMSSLFTAFVVWAILKWDTIKDESRANRWLILIAYVVGLSIGVHLLNLLTLPALALIYYFKIFKANRWGIAATLLLSGLIVLIINDIIIPGLPTMAGHFELFFVNTLGLFFGSGALAFIVLLIFALVTFIRYTHKMKSPIANTLVLGITFLLIGYGSYATIIIRSGFDPPINENAPKDVMSFVRYLKREQYGSRPLLFGPYFTSNPVAMHYTNWTYVKGKDKYEWGDHKYELEYPAGEQTILPRAWYPEDKTDYEQIMELKDGQQPTFTQNMLYMFRHQIGTMYMRYFMWNFVGRESDEQGADWLRPSQWFKNLPAPLASNKARNNFFMIPFILGVIGMFYHFMKDTKNFSVVLLMFFMLGTAIVLYLNSPPTEPRERDYIYVGSYYAFTFWIGLSVLAVADVINRIAKNGKIVLVAASVIGIIAPALMIAQGWDDHDRSDRFFSVDTAHNSLVSCDKNGILFTGGDNDTFPLWYAQETENCRTDLRVLVLSYSNAEWYIDQTTRQAYESAPFKYTLSLRDYRQSGLNNYLPFADFKIKSIDAKEYLELLKKEYPSLRDGDRNVVPSKIITLNVDKDEVLKKKIIPQGMEDLVVDRMELKLKGNSLEKADLVFIDLLTTSNWERPIYLNFTSLSQLNIDMTPYAVQEGNVYRILPVKNPRQDRQYLVDTEKTFDRMVNQFKYRGLDDPSVYYTDDYTNQVMNHRSNLNALAEAFVDKGEIEKASQVLNFSLTKMPDEAIAYDPSVQDTVNLLFKVGQKKKAVEIATIVGQRANEVATYLVGEGAGITFELRKNLFLLSAMERSLYENNESDLADRFAKRYEELVNTLQNKNAEGE